MISQLRQPSRQRFRPKVQNGGRIYRFPEVRSLEEKREVERHGRETLRRDGAVAAVSERRVRHELDLDSWNDGTRVIAPEKMLLLRILERASKDLGNSNPRIREDARSWITDDAEDGPCSFVSVCEALGRDPETVRRRLLGREVETWRARGASSDRGE